MYILKREDAVNVFGYDVNYFRYYNLVSIFFATRVLVLSPSAGDEWLIHTYYLMDLIISDFESYNHCIFGVVVIETYIRVEEECSFA